MWEIQRWAVDSPHKGPVMRALMFSMKSVLKNPLNKKSNCWWFETPWHSCDVTAVKQTVFYSSQLLYSAHMGYRNSKLSWWRHQMDIFSPLLALCEGIPPVTGGFPSQRPVPRDFDVFFDLRLNKRLSKQSRRWWFETPSRSLWRDCNINIHWKPRDKMPCCHHWLHKRLLLWQPTVQPDLIKLVSWQLSVLVFAMLF